MNRDIVNQFEANVLGAAVISTDTTTVVGSGIDTSDIELGIAIFLQVSAYTDGDYILGFEESEDDGGSDPYTTVPPEKFCNTPVAQSADSGTGELTKLGVFSTSKFLRATVASTNTSTGAAVAVFCVKASEYVPVPL